MPTDDTTQPHSGPTDDQSGPELLEDACAGTTEITVSGDPAAPPSGLDQFHTRWEFRCKICQLAIKYPTLYKMIHDMIIKDGKAYNAAMTEMNEYIGANKLGIPHFNMMNMLGHFNKHVDLKAKTAMALARSNMGAPPMVPAAGRPLLQYVNDMVEQRAKSEVDDYENLDEIRRRVTAVMNKLMDELEEADKDGKTKLSKHGLQLYVSLVSETRACINDLNKMRQSEKLMNTVVTQLLEKMTFSIIPQLLEEYKAMEEELRHANVDPDVIVRINLGLRIKTAQIIATTAKAAVVEIQRQFKLR
jgi:hypothetical protein